MVTLFIKLNPFNPCLELSNKVLDILVCHGTAMSSKLAVEKNLELVLGCDSWCILGRVENFFRPLILTLEVTGKVVIESIL